MKTINPFWGRKLRSFIKTKFWLFDRRLDFYWIIENNLCTDNKIFWSIEICYLYILLDCLFSWIYYNIKDKFISRLMKAEVFQFITEILKHIRVHIFIISTQNNVFTQSRQFSKEVKCRLELWNNEFVLLKLAILVSLSQVCLVSFAFHFKSEDLLLQQSSTSATFY